MEKKRNLWVLPTDKPSRLHTYKGVLNLAAGEFVAPTIVKNDLINLNIYITNDEEIKEGDWIFNEEREPSVLQCIGQGSLRGWNKIILTTDQSLIQDDIQAIDDEFLEWFVKNPSCDEVEVVKGFADGTAYGYNFLGYKIIIPKEEPKQENCCTPIGQIKRYVDCHGCDRKPKQEQEVCNHCGKTLREQMKGCGEITCYRQFLPKQQTLEIAAEVYANKKGDIPTTKLEDAIFKQGFIDGAKSDAAKNYWFKIFRKEFITWMQERMYSEEEVNDLLEMLKRSIAEINHLKYTYKDKGHCGKYLFDCETIIENFKKK